MIHYVYATPLILAKCLGHIIQYLYYSIYKCHWFQKENVLSVVGIQMGWGFGSVNNQLSVGDYLAMGADHDSLCGMPWSLACAFVAEYGRYPPCLI